METNNTCAHCAAIVSHYKTLTINDLCSLYDDAQLMVEAARNAYNTPRNWREKHYLTGGGEVVDDWLNQANERVGMIVEALTEKQPQSFDDSYERALILLKFGVQCGDSLPEIIAMAADLNKVAVELARAGA